MSNSRYLQTDAVCYSLFYQIAVSVEIVVGFYELSYDNPIAIN